MSETVLEEAQRIVDGDRGHSYGHPSDNHGCTAAMFAAYLSRTNNRTVVVTARDICWINILQKASRDANRPKRDNLADTCGYARNAEMITERDP